MDQNEWNQKLRKDIERIEAFARLAVMFAVIAGALVGWWLS